MADYYQLIAKAVAGLDPEAPSESRRTIYERARAALLAELRTINPPFTEAEITRERLALEEAVRRVEEETSQRELEALIPSFSNLVTDTEDLGKTAAVPPMIVTSGATGRLTRIWRARVHGHHGPPLVRSKPK
jgi:hypothetical protein